MIVLSCFVFAIVMVMFGYAIWKFRAKPGDESDGEPIHGNTRLEIAWTVIPTIIVLFGAGYRWIVLDDIEAKAADAMPVDVTAQQFKWTFEYPERWSARATRDAGDHQRAPRAGRPPARVHHRPRSTSCTPSGCRSGGSSATWCPPGTRRRRGRRHSSSSPRTRRAPSASSAPSSAGPGTRRCGRPWWSSPQEEFDAWVAEQAEAQAAAAGGAASAGGRDIGLRR